MKAHDIGAKKVSLGYGIRKALCSVRIVITNCNYFSKHMRSKKLVTELSPWEEFVKTYSHNLKKIIQVILIIQGDTDFSNLL